jgi:hypothetical protein
MKYSKKSLDYAIDTLSPGIKAAKDAGITFNRPEILRYIACDLFLAKELNREYNPSYKEMMCTYVVAQALQDLAKVGWFEFGDRELEDEV